MQDELKASKSKLLNDTFLFHENGGRLPNIHDELAFFNQAFDKEAALKLGKILPKRGVDKEFDNATDMKHQLENDVNMYLRTQKRFFSAEVKYFGNGNNAFQVILTIAKDQQYVAQFKNSD